MIIAAMSDLHGYLPEIPPCDLLIVAGDVCPDRFGPFYAMHAPEHQKRWFDAKFRPWVAAAPRAVLTWGNHDYCGQVRYWFEDDDLVAVDRVVEVNGLKIWLSPWSNRFGCWAFMDDPEDLGRIYAQIPDDVDIIVSHQPPYGCGDRIADFSTGQMEHIGSRELLEAIERVRPKLVICGHLHFGHGAYEHQGVPIYNVSVVDEQYQLVHPTTIIELEEPCGQYGSPDPGAAPGPDLGYGRVPLDRDGSEGRVELGGDALSDPWVDPTDPMFDWYWQRRPF